MIAILHCQFCYSVLVEVSGLPCGLLFVAVLYPVPFQPVLRALSWQPPQKGFLKAPLGFDISAPRL